MAVAVSKRVESFVFCEPQTFKEFQSFVRYKHKRKMGEYHHVGSVLVFDMVSVDRIEKYRWAGLLIDVLNDKLNVVDRLATKEVKVGNVKVKRGHVFHNSDDPLKLYITVLDIKKRIIVRINFYENKAGFDELNILFAQMTATASERGAISGSTTDASDVTVPSPFVREQSGEREDSSHLKPKAENKDETNGNDNTDGEAGTMEQQPGPSHSKNGGNAMMVINDGDDGLLIHTEDKSVEELSPITNKSATTEPVVSPTKKRKIEKEEQDTV